MFARVEAFFRRLHHRFSHREWSARRRNPATTGGEEPGLLLIQIDGLARTQLERAVNARRMPFLRRLIRREGAQVHDFYPGLPSTTAAVQAELHYGVRTAVPAFSFYHRIKRCHGIMCLPEWAKEVEAGCAAQAEGLLRGGSSWSNIYTGGADPAESHFCAASLGWEDLWRTGRIGPAFLFMLLHPLSTLLLAGLLLVELALAAVDLVAGVCQGEKLVPELQLVLSRVFVTIGLRELITLGAAVDVTRGLPVVHLNFVGYDEQAHRRGPDSAFAHWSLLGIDRAVRKLCEAAEKSPRRDYAVWIFSDHGQERTRSFDLEVEGGIEQVIRTALATARRRDAAWHRRSQRRPLARWWRPGLTAEKHFASWARSSRLSDEEAATFTVAAIGPLAHVYFSQPLDDERRRALARRLVQTGGVSGVVLRLHDDTITWVHATGETSVPEGAAAFLPHPEPLRAELAADLAALARHPYSGDLMLLGWSPGSRPWTFAPSTARSAPRKPAGSCCCPRTRGSRRMQSASSALPPCASPPCIFWSGRR